MRESASAYKGTTLVYLNHNNEIGMKLGAFQFLEKE